MQIVNASYGVLSDEAKRREYDNWLKREEELQEREEEEEEEEEEQPNSDEQARKEKEERAERFRNARADAFRNAGSGFQPSSGTASSTGFEPVVKGWSAAKLIGAAALIIAFVSWLAPDNNSSRPTNESQSTARTPTVPTYTRPALAPNNQPWPTTASYLKGLKQANFNGLARVTIDNSQNDSDVFVKLYSTDIRAPNGAYFEAPVRHVFIPARGVFKLNKVNAGNYDVRYRDLSTGALSRSESFILKEVRTSEGISYSDLTMTLYKVRDGNMQTYALSEDAF
jgi:hypothetical protein